MGANRVLTLRADVGDRGFDISRGILTFSFNHPEIDFTKLDLFTRGSSSADMIQAIIDRAHDKSESNKEEQTPPSEDFEGPKLYGFAFPYADRVREPDNILYEVPNKYIMEDFSSFNSLLNRNDNTLQNYIKPIGEEPFKKYLPTSFKDKLIRDNEISDSPKVERPFSLPLDVADILTINKPKYLAMQRI